MEPAKEIKKKNEKEETFEYKCDKDSYLIKIIFSSDEITFNIKNTEPYQYFYFESKFNSSELQKINPFFCQFQNVDKIGNLYLNLLKGKKIKLLQQNNSLELSFINVTEEVVNITIKKKELNENEKLFGIISNLVNDMQELKKENKEMKEKINELMQFKLKIEELKNEEERKFHNFKNSSILKDKEKIKMISDWIMPNRNIIYTQIYKASKDGATGGDFHRCCDNKGETLLLFETDKNYKFGAYTPLNWVTPASGEVNDPNDNKTFLFSLNQMKKFTKIQGKHPSTARSQKEFGPLLGGGTDLGINKDMRTGWCGNNTFLTNRDLTNGEYNFNVKEIEIFQILNNN